ncbi:uncharacterized protein EV420DRAFT_1502555 [Desarmillaria tabescens]|uniref:Golgi apparatus membrane protein TVP38 n=1 Tax=Armillaria tabescens TaxID=1929756 RepID=A0AA39TRM8_ARMTA|nr:uncharacterized protein EV420DRAFT_1502555 [Desarmillaria tabescens]KAK0468042.1 hypothetical protein EV420DRAFT_1502555 [Desarmillaria tabescens]
MDSLHRQPALDILQVSSSPVRSLSRDSSPVHRQSQSPFRYLHVSQDSEPELNEKRPSSPDHSSPQSAVPAGSSQPTPRLILTRPRSMRHHSNNYTRPRGLRIANLLKPWVPIILYGITSLAFVFAIALYKTEVFSALDELSRWLQADEHYGHAVLFILIFLTTIRAVISYFSALAGALVVFTVSRSLLNDTITRWLDSACTMKRVVRAIEKRPKLLFLIRLAPYPYNVMNCLLAAAPTLSLRTYTICTALSLFKVIIHTSVGASIHSFKDYHVTPSSYADQGAEKDTSSDTVAHMWTYLGIGLCVAILVYLSYVARKAVDEELEDDFPAIRQADSEERVAFLSPRGDVEAGLTMDDIDADEMAESPFRTQQVLVT